MHQKPSFFSKSFIPMPKMGKAEQQKLKCQYSTIANQIWSVCTVFKLLRLYQRSPLPHFSWGMIFDTCALRPVTLEQWSNNWLLVIPTIERRKQSRGSSPSRNTGSWRAVSVDKILHFGSWRHYLIPANSSLNLCFSKLRNNSFSALEQKSKL